MADFASDNFNTGSGDLVGTTPDVGGNWTDGSQAGTNSPVYASNRVRQDDVSTTFTYVDTAPGSADYYVQADVIPQSGGSGGVAGVIGRKTAGTGDPNYTAYWADYYDHATAGSRQWRLIKVVAATITVLGTYTENIGTTATTLKLEMIGTAIKLYVNGVERVSVTDSSVTAAGRAGVIFGAAASPTTNAVFLDDFTAGDIVQTIGVGYAEETDSAGAAELLDRTISVGTATETDSAPPTDPFYGTGAFLLDTFTDADGALLTAHTSESGHTWAAHPNWAASATVFSDNRLMRTNTVDQVVLSSVTPPDADYAATIQLRAMDAASVSALAKGVLIRGDASASTFYWAHYYDAATPEIHLYKFVSGTPTSLGSYNVTFAAGAEHHLTLEAIGSAIKVYLDGVAVISATDATITAAGRIGVVLVNSASADTSSTHVHIASINAVALSAQTIGVGYASETDSALAPTLVYDQVVAVGTALETDSAGDVNVDTVSGSAVGAQGGLAFLFTGAPDTQTVTVGTALESDSALVATVVQPPSQTVAVGAAVEIDSALTVTIPAAQEFAIGAALETDASFLLTPTGPGLNPDLFDLEVSEYWADGTLVGAFPELQFPYEVAQPSGEPTQTVAVADNHVVFVGLEPLTTYWAFAAPARIRFTTPVGAGDWDGGSAEDPEGDFFDGGDGAEDPGGGVLDGGGA